LLPVAVSAEAANSLMELAMTRPDAEVHISLPDQTVRWSDNLYVRFDIDQSIKWRLMEGLARVRPARSIRQAEARATQATGTHAIVYPKRTTIKPNRMGPIVLPIWPPGATAPVTRPGIVGWDRTRANQNTPLKPQQPTSPMTIPT
jgi:hypothetical protein